MADELADVDGAGDELLEGEIVDEEAWLRTLAWIGVCQVMFGMMERRGQRQLPLPFVKALRVSGLLPPGHGE